MIQYRHWCPQHLTTLCALAMAPTTFAQTVVVDAFDQPAGGTSITTLPSVGEGFNGSTVPMAGVPGGYRRLFVVTQDQPPIASATVTVNNGAPGFTLEVSSGNWGWGGASYGDVGYPKAFSLDINRFSAFRLDNVTTEGRIYVYLGISDQSYHGESLSFDITQPMTDGHVDFPLSSMELNDPGHPVDLTRISYINFGIIEYMGDQAHIGSLKLLPSPTAVPEPTTATIWAAGFLGLWAVGRSVARAKR